MTTSTKVQQNLEEIQNVTKEYIKIAKLPKILSAKITKNSKDEFVIASQWKQKDFEKQKNGFFQQTLTAKLNGFNFSTTFRDVIIDANDIEISCISNSGSKKAVITKELVDNKETYYLEIWNSRGLEVASNLTSKNVHGKIHFCTEFKSFDWSKDDSKLLYVAEKKVAESHSYFSPLTESKEPGNEHIYQESWGEALSDCHSPTVCVYDIKGDAVVTFENALPNEYSYKEAMWLNNTDFLVVGLNHTPFRQGITFGINYPSVLFRFNIETKKLEKLTDGDKSSRNPILTPDGNFLLYFETESFGPHNSCSKVKMFALDTNISSTLDIPNSNNSFGEHVFPGMSYYKPVLPMNCCIGNKTLIVHSNWHTTHILLAVDTATGSVIKLTHDGNWTLLDVMDNVIVASYSNPSTPPHLVIGLFQNNQVQWTHCPSKLQSIGSNIVYEKLYFTPSLVNDDFPELKFQCILHKAKNYNVISNSKLIVFIHGGPHSVTVEGFDENVYTQCQLGYAVVQVNYRGSFGYGNNSIYSLAGNIGIQDVADVQQAAEFYKKELRAKEVHLEGGSHGGVIILNLISKYPDFYTSAAIRNPNSNFVCKQTTGDNPAWVNFEIMKSHTFKHTQLPTDEIIQKCMEKSPIQLISKVKIPCILFLGGQDKRVPMSQGLLWAKKYKAYGGSVKVIMYKNDGHPLSSFTAQTDKFINTMIWFHL